MLKDQKIINLEINGVLSTSIFAKQGDNTRYLLFNLLDKEMPFSLVGRTVRVYAKKPDGTNVFNDLAIVDAENGQAELQLTTQMLAVAGNVSMELVIYEGTKILSTTIFILIVRGTNRNDSAVISTNEFSVLTNALADVNDALTDMGDLQTVLDDVNDALADISDLQTVLDGKVDNSQVLTNVPVDAKFTDTTYEVVSVSDNGLMSSIDKAKLDGVETGANNYVHPVNHSPSIITQDVNNRFVTDAEKVNWNDKVDNSQVLTNVPINAKFTDTVYTHPANHSPSIITQDSTNRFVTDAEKSTWNGKAETSIATTSANGLMSAIDKTKIDTVESNAEVNNISDVNAIDLTDGTDTTLHYHSADRSRVNHTGTQLSSTISNFASTVRETALTGITTATNAVISATDTVLSALGKLQKQVTDNLSKLTNHTENTSNPHNVTKTQIGLENVDNTTDLNKPISTATQTALDGKVEKVTGKSLLSDTEIERLSKISINGNIVTNSTTNGNILIDDIETNVYTHPIGTNPHSTTKADIGLSNVDNTSDLNKPISTIAQTALDGKVDNSQVLTNVPLNAKFTDTTYGVATTGANGLMSSADKTKIDNIEAKAEVNNISDINATDLTDNGDTILHYHATDRNRTNHTGTQLSATISDFANAARTTVLTGLTTTTNSIVTTTDTALSAFGKLQKQVTDNLDTLTSHTENTDNPHSVTKTQVGLGNVDNTTDLLKPISTATQTALNSKVDKVAGKSLLSDTEITRLTGISTNANKVIDSTTNGNILIDGVETNVYTHPIGTNPHNTTKTDIGLSNVDNTSDLNKPVSTATQLVLDGKINTSQKGVANGVAQLDSNGTVPSSQLPSYVNDILEYTSNALFPTIGESGKIYLNTTSNLTYRWSGTVYAEVSPSIALGETSSTAYAGDKGKATTDKVDGHIGNTTNPHNVTKAQVGLGNVDNVNTNGQTPTYTVASTNTTLTSGETLTTAFGKIAKAISSLIAHLADTVSHITSTERTNWNSASANNHTHSNKTTLDNTTASYTTAEQAKLSGIANNANNYTLPVASTAIGGVKSGTDITIDTSGNVSINDNSHNHVIGNVGGLQTALDGKVDDSQLLTNVPVDAKFTDTVTTINSKTGAISKADIVALGVPSQDTTYTVFTPTTNGLTPLSGGGTAKYLRADGTWATPPDTNTTYAIATTSANGLMSNADKTKLDGIATGANNYSLPIASAVIGGVKSGTDITVDASGNVSINDDSHNHVIANVDGLQTALDSKVDDSQVLTNVPAGAKFTDTVYAHPTTHAPSIIIQDTDNRFVTDVEKAMWNGKATTSVATTSANGLMPSTDKIKLNGISTGANKVTNSATNGNILIDAIETNVYTHPAGTNPHGTTKTDVGLGSVDNTADSAKNVLSATKLTTARTLALSGDVSGSVSFDGSNNATIVATVADDSHNHIISNIDGLQTALDGKATQTDINTSIVNINIGVRNLIVRYNELQNMMVDIDGTFVAKLGSSLMVDFIPVVAGEKLIFSQIFSGTGDNYFRYAFYQSDNTTLVRRTVMSTALFYDTVPANSAWLRVSYSSSNAVKLERGNKVTDWTQAPEDMAYKTTSGITSARPIPTHIGQVHFDTTLGKPIWCKTVSTPVWVDSTGTVV